MRSKSRARCKEISLLQQQITLLQNELTALKDKPISQCLFDLIERAGQWKEPSRMQNRKLTINAQTYMALLKSQDNVSVEKIPDTIRNVMQMYFGIHIDANTMKYLSTASPTAQLAIDRVADINSQMLVNKILSDDVQSLNLMMDDSNKKGMAMKLKLVNVIPPYDPLAGKQLPITLEILRTDDSDSKKGKLAVNQTFQSLLKQLGINGLMKIHSGTVDWLAERAECIQVMKSIDNLIETLNVVHIIKSCRGIPNLQYEYGAHIRQERVRPCQAYNHHRTKEKLLDTLGQEPIHQPDIICML